MLAEIGAVAATHRGLSLFVRRSSGAVSVGVPIDERSGGRHDDDCPGVSRWF
jgi:hypothetical protein